MFVYNITMKRFKHSGAFGDLIYSLPIVKHFGGGEFYLHLNQINWIGQHYYGSQPDPVHQGRLTQADSEFMRDFMLAQSYISNFDVLDTNIEITHNLDRFRVPFVGHPGNYVDIYSSVFGIRDPNITQQIRTSPWLTVPEARHIEGRDIVINRTARWLPPELPEQWAQWRAQGWEARSVFVGTQSEHQAFQTTTGWNIPWEPTKTMLDLAQIIAGSKTFIGNQSVALALAIGLGKDYYCELRRDLPINRNECYFPDQPGGNYF